jgi:hypothetical protein
MQEQRDAGECPFDWGSDVVPLTQDFCARFAKELSDALRNKELLPAKREEWEAQAKTQASAVEYANTEGAN